MPITMIEGFKYLPYAGSRIALVNASTGTSTWTRVAGRSGGYALRHTHSTTGDTASTRGQIKLALTPSFSIGFATYSPVNANAANSGVTGVQVYDTGGAILFSQILNSGQALYPTSGSSMSAPITTDTAITPVGWTWWNIVAIMDVNSGGYIRVYRNGVLVMQIAPDTASSFGSSWTSHMLISLGNSAGVTASGVDIADMIYRNDTTVIQDTRIDVLAPTSTATTGWTPSSGESNHLLIDDAGPTVDTSDYVSTSVIGTTDEYGVADLSYTPSAITAVGVHAIGRKDSGGFRTVAPMCNGVEGTAQDTGMQGVAYGYWETNPVGGAAWTKADIDAMTAGIKIKT